MLQSVLFQIQLALPVFLGYVSIQIQLSLYSWGMYQSRYNSLCIPGVCINPDTTLSVFLRMYQSRYNSPCILEYVSIQVQLSLYSWGMYQSRYNSPCFPGYVSIQIQLSQYSYVCINLDTTRSLTLKYVFIDKQSYRTL